MEWQSTVFIGIKELNKSVSFTLAYSKVALVSQEVQNFKRAYESIRIAVKSLERSMWCEITNFTEALTSCFQSTFTITNCNEKILKPVLRFVSEHYLKQIFVRSCKFLSRRNEDVWFVCKAAELMTYNFIFWVKFKIDKLCIDNTTNTRSN